MTPETLPSPCPRVSILVLMHNDQHQAQRCLDACLQQSVPTDQYEVVVIDNGSHDGTLELVRERYPGVRLVELGANYGFAAGNNRGMPYAAGEWVIFLNSDTEVAPDWLAQLLAASDGRPDVAGLHAAQVMDWSKASRRTGGLPVIPEICRWGYVEYRKVRQDQEPFATLHISGATAMVRCACLPAIHPVFDESFFMYAEDLDLGLRLNMGGYHVLAVPRSVVVHHQRNVLLNAAQAWRKARLASRNGWRACLNNMYLTEVLLYFPVIVAGSFMKPWQFPGRLGRHLVAGLGLMTMTLVYFPLELWRAWRYPEARRRALGARTRPWGWPLRRLWKGSHTVSACA